MTFTGAILALDLGKRTGFAVGPVTTSPLCGSVQLGRDGSSYGAVGSRFREWLAGMLDTHKPTLVCMEAPIPNHKSAQAARVLLGLAWQLESLCFDRGMYNVREATVQEIRQFFIGHGRMRSEPAKAMTMRKCRSLGWNPTDLNASDACAVWSYQAAIVAPGFELKRHTAA